MSHVTLEIPLAFLFFGGNTQGDNPDNARIQGFGDPFYRPAFPCSVPPFEKNNCPKSFVLDPFLEFNQFDLEIREFFLVKLFLPLLSMSSRVKLE